MNPKTHAFRLLLLVSCFVVFLLAVLNWMMTSLWLQGYGDVFSWASVVAISAVGLILLWRAANRAYKAVYAPERKQKEKNKHFERFEADDDQQAETLEKKQQNQQ
jgi:ABC-type nickel/cobalt efflux system permease component RcnA